MADVHVEIFHTVASVQKHIGLQVPVAVVTLFSKFGKCG
jgi:hypothetical protein